MEQIPPLASNPSLGDNSEKLSKRFASKVKTEKKEGINFFYWTPVGYPMLSRDIFCASFQIQESHSNLWNGFASATFVNIPERHTDLWDSKKLKFWCFRCVFFFYFFFVIWGRLKKFRVVSNSWQLNAARAVGELLNI